MSFNIGPAGDLAIFTNTNDDMFNISGDIGPNFILDQGYDRGIADIGITQNIAKGIVADMPNETPIDFINKNTVAELDIGTRDQRMARQKIISNVSDVTIEAEPEPVRKKLSSRDKNSQQQKFLSQSRSMPPPEPIQRGSDTPPNIEMNLGFDDLLDVRKLKPISDDAGSIGGDSQSTIRHDTEYPSAPNSPDYRSFKPVISDSPLPSTFQKDKERRKIERQPQPQPQSDYQPVYENEPSKYINEDDEKMDLLLKLQLLEKNRKISLSKHYNIKSSIDEIRMEYRNQTNIILTEDTVNFMKKGLVFCTSGLEYMNRRFDPVGAKLDGWSENIMENMMDYDGIFERLHNKYKGSVEMEPEMELLFALGGSAFMFHLSQTFFNNAIPQFGNVLRENPDVVKGFVGVAQEAVRRSQSTNNGMQGMKGIPMPANEMGVGGMNQANMQSPNLDFGSLLGQIGIGPGVLSEFAKSMGQAPPPAQQTRDHRDPPVNDLYRQMVQKHDDDDALSTSSHTSERSIGNRHGIKAVITPIPTSRRGGGGNIIKLS
jgi:hypothetical protein